jgi:steroid 5-alpha reductase family enzyme
VTPLVAGLVAFVAFFSVLWLVSLKVRDSSIVDIFWGPGFVLSSIAYMELTDGFDARNNLVAILLSLWGLRLAFHIGHRNIGRGEDFRYRSWREKYGHRWWWWSYFHVFLLQAVIGWIVSLPIYFATRAPTPARVTEWDLAGSAIFIAGFLFETIGDEQLRRFKDDPANQGQVMQSGLWRYSRHPNYFGEAVLWWGMGVIGTGTPGGAIGLIGPALITFLLLRVSGVTLLETTLNKTKAGYDGYVVRTSAFVPWIPRD